jgi:hypothetical protein
VKSRGRWYSEGVCWFVDDAREMIARAFALAALLRECDLPVTKLATRHPGQILYRDRWQVVAKPGEETPLGEGEDRYGRKLRIVTRGGRSLGTSSSPRG